MLNVFSCILLASRLLVPYTVYLVHPVLVPQPINNHCCAS